MRESILVKDGKWYDLKTIWGASIFLSSLRYCKAKVSFAKDSWTLFHTAPEVLPPDSDVLVYVFEPDRLELVDNERCNVPA